MPNLLQKTELQEWRILTIQDLGGKGNIRAINDELKKKVAAAEIPGTGY